MKQTLKATVTAVGETIRLGAIAPNGNQTSLAFDANALTIEQRKALGALYYELHAVTITIEAGEDNAAYLPEIETRLRASADAFGPDKYESAWLTRAADSVRRVWEGPPTTPIDEVAAIREECDRLRATVQSLTTDYQSAQARIVELNARHEAVCKLATVRYHYIAELESCSAMSAPPLVNGRPSCCERAAMPERESLIIVSSAAEGFFFGTREVNREICFCPFCGAKLPEVTP